MYNKGQQLLLLVCMLSVHSQEPQCDESRASLVLESPTPLSGYIPAGHTQHFRCATQNGATVGWGIKDRLLVVLHREIDTAFLNRNGISIETNALRNVSVLTLNTTAGENITTVSCRITDTEGEACFITVRIIIFGEFSLAILHTHNLGVSTLQSDGNALRVLQ